MTAWQLGCREGVLESLLEDRLYQDMDLDVALENITRVCHSHHPSLCLISKTDENVLLACISNSACTEGGR